MKVRDIMQKHVDHVTDDMLVKDAARLIFGRNINGLPVVKDKKLIGFVTEHDILGKFYPSLDEYIEDPIHAADFEAMEVKIEEILNMPVRKIMSKNPRAISPDEPVLKAQSIMQVKTIGRLPVVDEYGKLVGIIAKGDIFKAVVGKKLPVGQEEGFYDWMASHYDIFMNWKKRLAVEVPEISSVLKKAGVDSVIDVASSTGEHSLAFAQKGFRVYGVERSSMISELADRKKKKITKKFQNNAQFLAGSYKKSIKSLPEEVGAALFLGNALPHVLHTDPKILDEINEVIDSKKGIFIFQILNFEKLLKEKKGMEEFLIRDSHVGYEKKHAFLGFYTKEKTGELLFTESIYDFDGKQWMFQGLNSTPVKQITKADLTKILQKLGFKKITFYGGDLYSPLFKKPFDPSRDEFLNVIARR